MKQQNINALSGRKEPRAPICRVFCYPDVRVARLLCIAGAFLGVFAAVSVVCVRCGLELACERSVAGCNVRVADWLRETS